MYKFAKNLVEETIYEGNSANSSRMLEAKSVIYYNNFDLILNDFLIDNEMMYDNEDIFNDLPNLDETLKNETNLLIWNQIKQMILLAIKTDLRDYVEPGTNLESVFMNILNP